MTVNSLYMRRARLTVGTVQIATEADEGLRISFKVQKNSQAKEPNTSHIEVFNLNKASRDALEVAFDPHFVGPQHPGLTTVTLEAGYGNTFYGVGQIGPVFIGHTISILHTRERADWSTQILAADGLLTSEARVNKTFAKGLTFQQIITQLANEMKKTVKNLDIKPIIDKAAKGDFSGAKDQFLKAFTVSGLGMAHLERMVKSAGLEVSEQEGELILLGTNELRTGRAISLNADSGLIGPVKPVKDEKNPTAVVIKGKSLLRSDMVIGSGITLTTELYKEKNGLYKVKKLEHRGDTHGPEWYTEFEATSITV